MSIYICKDCGARLDPEERCDCKNEIETKNVDSLPRYVIMSQLIEWLNGMSDKNLKIVRGFVKGIVAREYFEKE